MKDYLDRVAGCFLGKSIGGTLGMPYEGRQSYLNLTFYNPVPDKPLPNDDLDLQIVWLDVMKRHGLATDCRKLGEAWVRHIDAPWDEYGVAVWNLKRGIQPPLSGTHNNLFIQGMGSAIRTELWASLFPGQPATAAWYAWQDAVVDHTGEGVYAEVFLAAAQSQLFVEPDTQAAFRAGLAFLPEDSLLLAAFRQVAEDHAAGVPYEKARDRIGRAFSSANFTDCVLNVAYTVLGLLYGDNDYEKSLLCAVNCGQDTDCTAATAGAWMGIIVGEKATPQRWRQPVGDTIVIGDYIVGGIIAPPTIGALTEEIAKLRSSFAGQKLPELARPCPLPDVQDFSDNNAWTADGRKIKVPGISIPATLYGGRFRQKSVLETTVRLPRDLKAEMMVCGKGLFTVSIDGVQKNAWASQADVVPAPHRVVGGRLTPIEFTAGRPVKVRIEYIPTERPTDLAVAFCEPKPKRHLWDIEYLES